MVGVTAAERAQWRQLLEVHHYLGAPARRFAILTCMDARLDRGGV